MIDSPASDSLISVISFLKDETCMAATVITTAAEIRARIAKDIESGTIQLLLADLEANSCRLLGACV